jgi:hypothetical protein
MDAGVLVIALSKLSTDPSSTSFDTPPEHYLLICTNQATMSSLLKAIPTLFDIDIASL